MGGDSGEKWAAFAKGGSGCLVAALALGLLCVLVGGRMHADIGGLILVFVVGGVLGLIALAVYNKGKRDGSGRPF